MVATKSGIKVIVVKTNVCFVIDMFVFRIRSAQKIFGRIE